VTFVRERMNVVVTGANTGIGRVTAEKLAEDGAHVWLACRSREKTQPVIDGIAAKKKGEAELLALDLADLESVRAAAKTLIDRDEPIDVLVNNAGLAGLRGTTKQGFELTFGTNHLGHFLFTTMLLPLLRKSAPSRIVNVSSKAHFDAKKIDWAALKKSTATITGVPEYEVSKLCNVLFTKELAREHAGDGVHSYAVHPGVIASDAWRQIPWPIRPIMRMFMKTTEEGAQTSLYCATSKDAADDDGLYYDESKPKACSPLGEDVALAKELWAKSEEWTS
jgi:NAD(P)-dependent dehydrogenase (short-subunit alcohol dehydrogenase family)